MTKKIDIAVCVAAINKCVPGTWIFFHEQNVQKQSLSTQYSLCVFDWFLYQLSSSCRNKALFKAKSQPGSTEVCVICIFVILQDAVCELCREDRFEGFVLNKYPWEKYPYFTIKFIITQFNLVWIHWKNILLSSHRHFGSSYFNIEHKHAYLQLNITHVDLLWSKIPVNFIFFTNIIYYNNFQHLQVRIILSIC